ncbi:MAG: hypothetical protein RIC56_03770 [Pseudomonadales bacterium]
MALTSQYSSAEMVMFGLLVVCLIAALVLIVRPSFWKKSRPKRSPLHPCPDCGQQVSKNADRCPHCGARTAEFSDGLAFFLAFLFGPVGLWYKQRWAAGFAWLVMTVVVASVAPVLVVFCWIGMIVHAASA